MKDIKSKTDLIKLEEKRLKKILEYSDRAKKGLNQNLINNAAFMGVTLQLLREDILEEGAIIEIINGNGLKTIIENPSLKLYNKMVSRYFSVIKQLTDLIQKDAPEESDAFLDFIKEYN